MMTIDEDFYFLSSLFCVVCLFVRFNFSSQIPRFLVIFVSFVCFWEKERERERGNEAIGSAVELGKRENRGKTFVSRNPATSFPFVCKFIKELNLKIIIKNRKKPKLCIWLFPN